MRVAAVSILAGLALVGCASRAENIAASYASPTLYQSLSCPALTEEAARVSGRVAELTQRQNNKAVGDAVATGVALVLFWPAAFMVSGDGATAAELGRLKGEMVAIEQANTVKRCGIVFNRAEG